MTGKRPDLVIFDCDGVLVDTERIAVPIDVALLAELGWEMSASEVVERFLGMSDADCKAAIEAYLGEPVPPEVSFETDPRYREAFERDLAPVDGVVESLDALERAGVATCVASGGTHSKMRFTLGLTGLYERFDGRIYSAEDVTRGKPAPDLFLLAASELGVPAPRCAVVEDSPLGLEAAIAAGMSALAYAGGLTPRSRLAVAGATLFEDMRALPTLLGLAG